jgi:hypothetical protein
MDTEALQKQNTDLLLALQDAKSKLGRATKAQLRGGFEDHGGEEWKPPIGPAPRFVPVFDPGLLAALRQVTKAALAYDKAIHLCANDPEVMSSYCTAQGESLDRLYAKWIAAAEQADELLEASQAQSAPASAPDAGASVITAGVDVSENRIEIAVHQWDSAAAADAGGLDASKAVYWFDCLAKCARLLGLPDDEPVPSGVVAAVEKLAVIERPTAVTAGGLSPDVRTVLEACESILRECSMTKGRAYTGVQNLLSRAAAVGAAGLSPCPCCPQAIRNLHAVAHNICTRTPHIHDGELKRAVDQVKPLMDAHFADPEHSHGAALAPHRGEGGKHG